MPPLCQANLAASVAQASACEDLNALEDRNSCGSAARFRTHRIEFDVSDNIDPFSSHGIAPIGQNDSSCRNGRPVLFSNPLARLG